MKGGRSGGQGVAQVRGDAGNNERLLQRYLSKLDDQPVFNIVDAERYLLLARDIPGMDARLTLRPGSVPGEVVGENISETYETEIQTLSAWMGLADTRDVILNPAASQMGFGWFQEPSGKIWWTLVTGR